MDIEFYKNQHVELLDRLSKIENRLESEISESIEILLHELAGLSARLILHISMEENFVFPRWKDLILKKERAFQEEYLKKATDFKIAFKEYNSKWSLPSSILQRESEFRKETRRLIVSLRMIVKREEAEIYSILEKESDSN
ncbi:hemerythrin HHE cation-binding domain protein [Leptospira sp. 201903070]|uniref:Hemerythrin HHE cation-binding domain protein n=1 Tax=Leptospira ainlahdjerensis TaxID=2810033 RepID=A0ABS2UG00_9LEPT|nr:hemerythrin HHE cation-binding domain protein [Leptospira ainlahdjerensis]MBM9579286.1 hemerythrin HHE cation-binding domain protein [Leptospira ainlahdjerensis]